METKFQLTDVEANVVSRIYENVLSSLLTDKSVRDNMVSYLRNRNETWALEISENAVDKLIKGVAGFRTNYAELKNDETTFAELLNESMKDLTLTQKYDCMLNFLATVKALDISVVSEMLGNADADIISKFEELKQQTLSASEGEITEEMLEELTCQIQDAISDSTVCVANVENLKSLINELPSNGEAGKSFVVRNMEELDDDCYTALATYVAFMEGNIETIPADTDPELIAVGVAAGKEHARVIEQARCGIISWEFAAKCLKYIGMALLIGFFAWITFKVFCGVLMLSSFAIAAFLGGSFLAALTGLVVGAYLTYLATSWLVDKEINWVDGYSEVYDKVMAYIKTTLYPTVIKGIAVFVTFVREKIIGGVIRMVKPQQIVEVQENQTFVHS